MAVDGGPCGAEPRDADAGDATVFDGAVDGTTDAGHDGGSGDGATDSAQDVADGPDAELGDGSWCSGEAGPGGTPYCYLDASTWCCLPGSVTYPNCPPNAQQPGGVCGYAGSPYPYASCYWCPGGGGGPSVGEGCGCTAGLIDAGLDDAGNIVRVWYCLSAENECTLP
jgi:hypothetical protein